MSRRDLLYDLSIGFGCTEMVAGVVSTYILDHSVNITDPDLIDSTGLQALDQIRETPPPGSVVRGRNTFLAQAADPFSRIKRAMRLCPHFRPVDATACSRGDCRNGFYWPQRPPLSARPIRPCLSRADSAPPAPSIISTAQNLQRLATFLDLKIH